MAKIGISVKIDLSKIDESRVFQGKNGARYLDLTSFIDTEKESQYGDHGFISQATTKEEREAKVQTPILGNTKVFYTDIQGGVQQFQQGQHPQHQAPVYTPPQHQQTPQQAFAQEQPMQTQNPAFAQGAIDNTDTPF